MNQREEKKRTRNEEEEEEESRNEEERRYDEEEDMQGGRKQMTGDETERERGGRVERRGEGGKERNEQQGRYAKEITADHAPQHPVAAPYFKWKVFVRGSEGTLEGRGVREEGEDWREKHTFTSALDGEATRSFYESVTRQTDRGTERHIDTHTDPQIDRENEGDISSREDDSAEETGDTDRNSESQRETERHQPRTSTDRSREREADRKKLQERNRHRETVASTSTDKRQRERHKHANTNRQTEKLALNTHPTPAGDTHPHAHPSTSTSTPTPQELHTALRFAENNDAAALTAMLDQGMSVNTKDGYGWSLLMVAACAGAADVVRTLLTRKARTGLRDAKGNTALYLATIKGHRSVTEMLIKANKRRIPEREDNRRRNGESSSSETAEDEEYFCDTCGITVKEQERTKHKASIVHQFKAESGPVRTHYGIPPTNRGYQLLVGQGWDTEGGLGSEKQGQKFPVKTVLKRDREGIGAEGEGKSKARVTHFGPGDVAAVRRDKGGSVRVERAGTVSKREMRRRKEREQEEEVRLRRMLNEPDY